MSDQKMATDREFVRSRLSITKLADELGLPETTLAKVLAALRSQPAQVQDGGSRRPWLSIADVAAEMGMSEMTLYRVIAADEFPAVRVGRRLFIPARVLDEMSDAALAAGRVVSAAEWCGGGR